MLQIFHDISSLENSPVSHRVDATLHEASRYAGLAQALVSPLS